jgi:hypothetical protein
MAGISYIGIACHKNIPSNSQDILVSVYMCFHIYLKTHTISNNNNNNNNNIFEIQ